MASSPAVVIIPMAQVAAQRVLFFGPNVHAGRTSFTGRVMRENIVLDRIDRRILAILQEDANRPVGEIGEAVALSQTACWKRIKRLEREGVILRRVALLDRDLLGLGVTVMVAVRTAQHSEKWLEEFAQGVSMIPEVVEFYRMSGEIDYLLKVVVRDIADYDRIYRKLTKVAPLHDVSSSFAMQEIKSTTALPVLD